MINVIHCYEIKQKHPKGIQLLRTLLCILYTKDKTIFSNPMFLEKIIQLTEVLLKLK